MGPLDSNSGPLGMPRWLVAVALLVLVGSGGARALQVLRRHSEQLSAAQSSAERPHSVRITMYSTRWCGVCKTARNYMQQNSIAFTDIDVEHDTAAGAHLMQLNPRGSVPTITIEDEVLVGFSAAALNSAIERAAHRPAGG